MKHYFIERIKDMIRIAVTKNDKLQELYMEEEKNEPKPGEIYCGRVDKVLKSSNCAFIDIGYKKNAFLTLGKGMDSLKNGENVIVEILKEEIGDKGAKVTTYFNVPGTYAVLAYGGRGVRVSKNIRNEEEIERIKESIKPFDDAGIIIRSNSENVDISIIKQEVDELYDKYKGIIRDGNYSLKLKKIYSDGGILGRIINGLNLEEQAKIVVNNDEDYKFLKEHIEKVKGHNIQLEIYSGDRELFHNYGLEMEILNLKKRRVDLKCGGYIIIDKTEAMHIIDVNSGSNTGGGREQQEIAFKTNIEAAEECVRQIKLRNLSGIIIIDFIDIRNDKKRKNVFNKVKGELHKDKNKVMIYPFTELNLLQIARRRRGKCIDDYLYESKERNCLFINRLKYTYLLNLIRNDILEIKSKNNCQHIKVEIDEIYREDIEKNKDEFLRKIERENINIYLQYTNQEEIYRVNPLYFKSQWENLIKIKISD